MTQQAEGPLAGAGSGLSRIEIHRLRLPLAQLWVSPVATMVDRDVLLVAATVDGVVGWGECVAQHEPTYSPEYVDGALDVMIRHLIPRALAVRVGADRALQDTVTGTPALLAGVEEALAPVKGHPMAREGLTTAVLDACLRSRGVSLASHLGALSSRTGPGWVPPASVAAGVAIGVAGDVGALIREVAARLEEGYHRVKIKVRPGWDAVAVNALRQQFGPALALQVDANGSYGPLGVEAAAAHLAKLDGAGLLLIEQPLGDDDLVGHAGLARRLATPLCLDESITSVDVARSALALGACRVINIKPGRVGGLGQAVAIHDLAADAGVGVWCGGMLETGVGRAANLALAALPNFCLPGDLSASERYFTDDVVTEPAVLGPGGQMAVPRGPGIGVEIRSDLDRWLVWSDRWTS